MTTWFTSDLHLGDPWTTRMRYCGDDVAKHDAWLASRWDANVYPGDHVWVLGDVAVLPPERQEELVEWFAARPGYKHLVLGNQDERSREFWRYRVGFDSVAARALLHLGHGVTAVASHYPTTSVPDGAVLLHGHTHRRQKVSRREDGVLCVHVGWEAWRRYVPEQDLLEEVGAWA